MAGVGESAPHMRSIEFTVLGTPAPKGSRRGMTGKDGKGKSLPGGSRANEQALVSWSSAVRAAAQVAVDQIRRLDAAAGASLGAGVFFAKVPLRLKAVFRMRRPASHFNPKTGELKPAAPKWCVNKPDGSKLLRATEDDLHGIVILDDAHFAEWLIRKIYANPGQPEGAWLRIEEIEDR